MKNRAERLKYAASAAYIADRILTGVLALLLVLAILYSGYALWDTYMIYKSAAVDSELLKYKPNTDNGDAPNPTLSELQEINPDVCAWLTVDDTNIDYPVVQGKTNLEYINKDVYGEYSLSGSVFLDCRNTNDFSDSYSLLYAHHMEGKVMFGELPEFQKAEYFQTHTSGTLSTLNRNYSIAWFACIYTDAYDDYIFQINGANMTQEKKEKLLSYLKEKAVQYRELENLTSDDQLLALSTCSDMTTNGRVVLFGRMTEIVE
jgi:sortase B